MSIKEDKLLFIKQYALQQFKQYGYGKVTMDEIAKGTGTGKGTLYRYFPSKDDLLLACIQQNISEMEQDIEEAMEKNIHTVERLQSFFSIVSFHINSIDIRHLAEIERKVPKAYRMIQQAREKLIRTNLIGMLEEGKKNGVFRPNLDSDFTSKMLIGVADHMTRPEVLLSISNKNLKQVFREILSTILYGCLTEEERKKESFV